eukprot:TRINITY_DN27180_c0_g1_i1.p1 TRINITY_DN27180_c0_g1~~TRINITY_DN27180_c0_g1_i1.p1  ORF type:complete len:532 (-),score=89.70 TRINITY_DN27180_c0_g1_i1:194-1753(-)
MCVAASPEFQELLRLLADQHLQELQQASQTHSNAADQSHTMCPGPSPQLSQSQQVPTLPLEDLPSPCSKKQSQSGVDLQEAISSQADLKNRLEALPFSSEARETTTSFEDDLAVESGTWFGKLRMLLVSDHYEVAIGSLIMLNVCFMAVEIQYDGDRLGFDMGYPGMNQNPEIFWERAMGVVFYLNYVFTSLFVLDIAIRVPVLGCGFWKMWANWLDFVVVGSGVVELALGKSKLPVNCVFLRMLRLVKSARGLRLIRFSRILESFHLLLKCLTSSVNVLFWSLCVLFVIQCIAGMIISQLVKGYLDDDSIDVEAKKEVFRYYGTFSKTILTMFEVLFANWAPACRILLDHVSEAFMLFFIFYRCLVGFAVLNVMNAVFIQQTMKVVQADQELVIAQKHKAAENYGKRLKLFFSQLDTSGDGHLSWDEFSVMLTNPRMKHWMGSLELESHDLVNLFHMIDDGDGQISVDEFLSGAGRLKGQAKSVDVANVLAMVKRMDHKLDSMMPCAEKKGDHCSIMC